MPKSQDHALLYERIRSALEALLAELPPGDAAVVPLRRALDSAIGVARSLTETRPEFRAARYSRIRRWRNTSASKR